MAELALDVRQRAGPPKQMHRVAVTEPVRMDPLVDRSLDHLLLDTGGEQSAGGSLLPNPNSILIHDPQPSVELFLCEDL